MKSNAEIIQFKNELSFDDIICVLNPLQSCDLKQILLMTQIDRRLSVALSFSDITIDDLARKSGLDSSECSSSLRRWIKGENKLPLGAAFRLAKVFGVPVEILFESPRYYDHK